MKELQITNTFMDMHSISEVISSMQMQKDMFLPKVC